MPYKSLHPDIQLPTDVAVWSWLFESPRFRDVERLPRNQTRGVTNATTNERIDYITMKSLSKYLSTALVKEFGLKAGNTVALFSPNSVWYPVAMHGTLRAGGIIEGASPAYSVQEMANALQVGEAKFIMTTPESLEIASAAASQVGMPLKSIFLLEGSAPGFTTLKNVIELGRQFGESGQIQPFQIPTGSENHEVCGFLSFSSGTTGKPKAVMISHQNVIAQCLQMKQITAPDYEKVLAILPLFHITGLVHILHLPVILNAEVIMLPKFSMKSMLDCVVEYQLKELIVVPPILIRFTRDPIVDQYDLSCLRRFSSGAAPLPDEVIQLLEKKFPNTGFKQGYGMTESCSCLTAHSPDMYDYKHAQSVGGIVPNTQIKFVDPSGKEGNKGHILAKGPQCAMGYLNNPVADKASFNSDGWLHTGDEGSIDDRGIVTITGRLKDIIKVKGIAVSPSELEELLLQHPKVNDAAVIGIPDSYSGERPKGYIVLSFGEQPSEKIKEELAQYVKDRKIRTKWLAEIELIDEIPRAGSGKILRRVLQDLSRETRKMEKARL